MTHVRFNSKPVNKSFNNLVDDFFATMPSLLGDDLISGKQIVPVNIRETETDYVLEVIAPGFEKEAFKISLDNNTLTVEAEHKYTEENKAEKRIRSEYRYQSFKRSFTVNENVDTENISAKYVNGVLTLNLGKKGEVKPSVKQISIQ
jgi:HSP20 family protein